MAIQRINIDTRGKNIIEIFRENMNEIGAINKLSAGDGAAETYDGNGGEVNITWPRTGNYNSFDNSPDPSQSYFVREITTPINSLALLSGVVTPISSPLSPEENDDAEPGVANSGVDDVFAGKSSKTLKYTDNPYSGGHRAGNFLKLKSRKSLYTLLQETQDAFFESPGAPVYRNPQPAPDQSSVYSNRYDGGEEGAYDFKFMSEQGRSFVDPPNVFDITNQAIQGFALGQIVGGNVSFAERVKAEAQRISREYLEKQAADAEEDSITQHFFQTLAGMITPAERVSQLYVPGWGRPAENWLTKKPLSEVLNQNILLPPGLPLNDTGNGEGLPGYGNYANTFTTMYTRNRAGEAGNVTGGGNPQPIVNKTFDNGIIAGTAVNLLQEPLSNMNKEIIRGATPTAADDVPFSFEADDAKYLTWEKRDAGFRSNTNTANSQPDKQNLAVRDYSYDPDAGMETVKFSQGQQFPFVFSTVNKIDGGFNGSGQPRFQICYLQAIINSLSETYAPVWASRHFFGRSEQAHTYTFTDRTIDIGFTIYANEMRTLQNVYERVLWLAQQCYPDYDNTGRMKNGPIVAMRVGDLFQYKVGIIRNLSYDWLFNGGKWETTAGVRMPQGCTVTMSYQVIHEKNPTRDMDYYGGPAGGLNAATRRHRTISGDEDAGGAFDVFSDTKTSSVGYGEDGRFIPGGILTRDAAASLDEKDYLTNVGLGAEGDAEFYASRGTTLEGLQRIPVGVDSSEPDDIKPIFAD